MANIAGIFNKILSEERMNREIQSMSEMQARDLGMTKSDLFALANGRPNVAEQIKLMAEEFGISQKDITKERWRELEIVHNCNHCSHHKSCNRFFTEGADFSKDLCPNSHHYKELQDQKEDAA